MRSRINGSRIKRNLEAKERAGTRVTLYLNKDLYRAFKAHCGRLKGSQVVAELMVEFIATTSGPYRSKYKKTLT